MLQCFPALTISEFKPYCSIETQVQPNPSFVCETYFVFTNGRIETQVQPNPSFVCETFFVF